MGRGGVPLIQYLVKAAKVLLLASAGIFAVLSALTLVGIVLIQLNGGVV